MTTAATAIFSNTAPPPNLRSLVPRIAPRPVFFIFATKGRGGEQLSSDFYEAARKPKELWEIPDAGHTDGITARPEEYEQRVVGFFDRALVGG
ncbi:MAG TPA: alpha/beta hydrolase [Gaiellaceae bacterium]|nr:alpha/beta hydrolase [Gaiellaceae bacterium]